MNTPKKSGTNYHGLFSLLLISISMGIGVYATAFYSATMAIVNGVSIILFIFSVSYYYCSKCMSRNKCNHWLLGKISKLISKNKIEKYNTFDMLFGVVFPGLIVIILPQYWLIRMPQLLTLYWILMIIAFVEIRFFVCTVCQNRKCSMCKNKQICI